MTPKKDNPGSLPSKKDGKYLIWTLDAKEVVRPDGSREEVATLVPRYV